jgi:2-polyprenyl-6-hydroxyphenyl methylase/3-demethylubiquinone-9 3-methyltransferase
LAGKSVGDIGCGGGLLTEGLAIRGAKVLGIDLSEAPLSVAELHALESNVAVNYRCIAAENLAQEMPGSFEIVACMELLEHVPNPALLVDACARLVRPGGFVFFSTLNRNLKSFLFAIIGAEYILGMLPKGTHRFDRFILPSELAGWSRQADLQVRDITGLSYDLLTQTYCLGKDATVNYLMACEKDS